MFKKRKEATDDLFLKICAGNGLAFKNNKNNAQSFYLHDSEGNQCKVSSVEDVLNILFNDVVVLEEDFYTDTVGFENIKNKYCISNQNFYNESEFITCYDLDKCA